MVDSVTNSDNLCKCCLNENGLRDMWAGYISTNTGEFEIYGQMITDCFNLPWDPPEDETTQELICDSCIERLRISYNFKKEIIEASEILTEVGEKNMKKEENNIDDSLPIEEDDEQNEEKYEVEWLTDNLKEELETEYENVEYLEDDEEYIPAGSSLDSEDQNSEYEPKKKRKRDRTYKKYTDVDLKIAKAAVRNKTMTCTEACQVYKLPRSTLRFKLKKKDDISSADAHLKFVKEIQTVLKYTNATPFKSRTAKLLCVYCTKSKVFEDPEELRDHTRTTHIRERIRNLEYIMRPAWVFETLRIDINDLQCTICCNSLDSWQDMLMHLEEKHKIILDYTQKKLIPYILKDQEYNCALCDKIYRSYYHLDIHMNNHYKNHLCLECGDSFVSETRLKKHLKTHNVGKFPCEICGVVFTLENYRKKHYENMHDRANKIKCNYCKEKFQGEYQRHLHVVEKHNEKVKTYTCSVCHRDYSWRPYYLKHLKRAHNKTKEYECKICNIKFDNTRDRRQHNLDVHKKISTPNSNIKLIRKANDELVRKNRMNPEEEMKDEFEDGSTFNIVVLSNEDLNT